MEKDERQAEIMLTWSELSLHPGSWTFENSDIKSCIEERLKHCKIRVGEKRDETDFPISLPKL